eukprot:Unigene230_Nuclearia_a/m.834 Unigene230_Nuclearia_a/g.834  ORF Unigene230_Nuclearia_a/g.834 Unigene230_Nuclearia_a/m.834 type:complete len:323 (+) Unigene230_Nuclearia_a:291-1259(+)
MDDRLLGFVLAAGSAVSIGTSFVVKKHGLSTSEGSGTGSSYAFLLNPIWWGGTFLMAVGEVANFAAYSFAPAILVTPMGALSVVISAVLASLFLGERLDRSGKIGCGLCAIGTTVIVLHAPHERDLQSINEIVFYISQPAFVVFLVLSLLFIVLMLWLVAPKHGRHNMLVYISVCSFGGALLVIACKGVGVAVRVSLAGNNQMTSPYTYVFLLCMLFGLLFQLNYLNKALDLFPAAAVSPVYYVFFTTTTIVANLICFQGAEVQSARDVLNVICGFAVMCIGVFLLWSPNQTDIMRSMTLKLDDAEEGTAGGGFPKDKEVRL